MANLPIAHAAADVMQHLVEHDWHGYTQGGGRWGDGEGYCYIDTGVGTLATAQGDRDCSSAIISAYQAAGVNTNGATYTGNMYSCFMATGEWVWHSTSDGYNCDDGYTAQRGDIYLHHQNHTAMCAYPSPDTLYEFVGNEFGGITGGAVGDQTGGESITRGYYGFPWHGVLEFIGSGSTPTQMPHQPASNPVNEMGFWYRAHTAGVGWLDSVRDGMIAGTVGYSAPIEAIKITPPVGLVLDVKLHMAGYGWKTWHGIENGVRDEVMGTTGEARQIEGVEIVPVKNETGKTLYYRTHLANTGWTPWVQGGYASGSVGLEKAIEAIEIKII